MVLDVYQWLFVSELALLYCGREREADVYGKLRIVVGIALDNDIMLNYED